MLLMTYFGVQSLARGGGPSTPTASFAIREEQPLALGSTVSVIIPTYNRIDALRQTLSALETVQYPSDRWEVVIVDDGSSDGTEEIVQNCIRRSHVHIRYLRQANGGPASARNRG